MSDKNFNDMTSKVIKGSHKLTNIYVINIIWTLDIRLSNNDSNMKP